MLLQSVDVPGGELRGCEFDIIPKGEEESVLWDGADRREVRLFEGTYNIHGWAEGIDVWKRGIEIPAGQRTAATVVAD